MWRDTAAARWAIDCPHSGAKMARICLTARPAELINGVKNRTRIKRSSQHLRGSSSLPSGQSGRLSQSKRRGRQTPISLSLPRQRNVPNGQDEPRFRPEKKNKNKNKKRRKWSNDRKRRWICHPPTSNGQVIYWHKLSAKRELSTAVKCWSYRVDGSADQHDPQPTHRPNNFSNLFVVTTGGWAPHNWIYEAAFLRPYWSATQKSPSWNKNKNLTWQMAVKISCRNPGGPLEISGSENKLIPTLYGALICMPNLPRREKFIWPTVPKKLRTAPHQMQNGNGSIPSVKMGGKNTERQILVGNKVGTCWLLTVAVRWIENKKKDSNNRHLLMPFWRGEREQ